MNQPTLNTGLAHLLEASRVKSQYPGVVCFGAYNTEEQDVLGSGLEQLVRFRLLHPETPVLFFSFLPLDSLLPNDKFGILKLNGFKFIQLPCSKETIYEAVNITCLNLLNKSDETWKIFSEKAAESLLKKQIQILMHANKLDIGNKILNPMRLCCVSMKSFPEIKEQYNKILDKNLKNLNSFIKIDEINEILRLSMIGRDSKNALLKKFYNFAYQLYQLSEYDTKTNPELFVLSIDSLNGMLQEFTLLNFLAIKK